MRLERLNRWKTLWIVASVAWVGAVAFYFIWHHATEVERLRVWADSVEWLINADPMVPVSAKKLRGELGDEAFIAAAPAAYPQVDLRQTIQRYESDRAKHRGHRYGAAWFVLWSALPPAVLYLSGAVVILIGPARTKRAETN